MTRDDLRRDPPLPRLIFGLAVIAAGVLFWLDRMGRIEARDYLHWWPVLPILIGLAQFPYRKWVAGAVYVCIGLYFLFPLIGLPRAHVRHVLGLWPLMISYAGFMLVQMALRSEERTLSAAAVMGGNVQRVASRFRRAEAVAVMGGCEIDLTHAQIEHDAVVDVLAFWGGVEIRVPRGWRVVSNATMLLGGLVIKTDPAPAGAPQLLIRGAAVMAGIEVKHSPERAA